jgi:hypothetical protein
MIKPIKNDNLYIIECVIFVLSMFLGFGNRYFMVVAFIIAIYVMLTRIDSIYFLAFTSSFTQVFKIDSSSITLFSFLPLIGIITLVFYGVRNNKYLEILIQVI